MKKIFFLIYVMALLHNNTNAQKNDLTNIAIASGVGIGLAAILSDNGDYAQDFLESRMLDYILLNEQLKLPQKLKVSLLNKPVFEKDWIKASCFIFNVKGDLFGNYVYIMVIGTKGSNFNYRNGTYLKYDRTKWEQTGTTILKSLIVNKKENSSENLFITENKFLSKKDTVNFYNLSKIENSKIVFSWYKGGDNYEEESFLEKIKLQDDIHILTDLNSDLNHLDQKFIFDFSELHMNIFLPLLKESVFLSKEEFVQITKSLQE